MQTKLSQVEQDNLAKVIIDLEREILTTMMKYPWFASRLDESDIARVRGTLTDKVGREIQRANAVSRVRALINQAELLTTVDIPYTDILLLSTRIAEWFSLVWQLAMSGEHILPRMASRYSKNEQDDEDARQDGYLGLFDAAIRYEPGGAASFATHARHWTKARVIRESEANSHLIALSSGREEKIRAGRKHINEVYTRTGETVSRTELHEFLKTKYPKASDIDLDLIFMRPGTINFSDLEASTDGTADDDYQALDWIPLMQELSTPESIYIQSEFFKQRLEDLFTVAECILPQQDITLLVKYHRDDLTFSEIAALPEFGITAAGAHARYSSAMQRLRSLIWLRLPTEEINESAQM